MDWDAYCRCCKTSALNVASAERSSYCLLRQSATTLISPLMWHTLSLNVTRRKTQPLIRPSSLACRNNQARTLLSVWMQNYLCSRKPRYFGTFHNRRPQRGSLSLKWNVSSQRETTNGYYRWRGPYPPPPDEGLPKWRHRSRITNQRKFGKQFQEFARRWC